MTPPIPFPDPAVLRLLADLPALAFTVGGRVSSELDGTLPALRVTKVYDREQPSSWETVPVYQVEVWTRDEFQAGTLAWNIANTWPTAKAEIVGDALVHGRWVEANPIKSNDPDYPDLYRYLIHIGIRLSGVPL